MAIGAVLLAAGRGNRLRPLTDRVPKPALPVLDVPLGAFCLTALRAASPPVVVNVAHLPQLVTAALTAGPAIEHVETLLEQPEPFGTAGTLKALAERLTPTFMVANADIVTDLDFAALLFAHRQRGARATIAISQVTARADLAHDGERATAFIDRRAHADAPGGRYLGVAAFERDVVSLIADRRPLGLAEAVLRPLVECNDLAVFVHDGYWCDAGTPARYLELNLDLLAGRGPKPPWSPPGSVVETAGGSAYVSHTAEAPHAELSDGAIVLAGARVEPGARLRHSIVWPGEAVPAGTALERAIWADGKPLSVE